MVPHLYMSGGPSILTADLHQVLPDGSAMQAALWAFAAAAMVLRGSSHLVVDDIGDLLNEIDDVVVGAAHSAQRLARDHPRRLAAIRWGQLGGGDPPTLRSG